MPYLDANYVPMTYIPTQVYAPGFPLEWEGLDYDSANEATPRLYGVSYGNGNDGVSHIYYDFSCRTCAPYALARLAMITLMKDNTQDWAADVVDVDGEAEYGISATIYDPPSDPREDGDGDEDGGSWCDSNGAWMIVEVFLLDADHTRDKPEYDNLNDCFGADVVNKYMED